MAVRMVLLSLLCAASLTSAIKVDFSETAWKTSPVQRVVAMLKEMAAQLEHEAKEDQDMYDGMACWCETNSREKAAAIESAKQREVDLESTIQESAAKAAQTKADVEYLTKQVAEQKASLTEATEIRAKEQGEFRNQEKDMLQSVASLKNAVRVMGKVQLSQLPKESLAQVQEMLRHPMEHHKELVMEALSSSQHRMIVSLLQTPSKVTGLLQQKTHAPSSAIFGILKQMKEEFETNLVKMNEEEKQGASEFASLKAAKTQEIKAAENLIDTKTVEGAEAVQTNAQSKEDLVDTRVALKADQEFLQTLTTKCANFEHEYAQRVKVRGEETEAVSQTITILTEDDASESLQATNFLQVQASKSSRNKASMSLQKAAQKLGSAQLAALAASVRFDPFVTVRENIDALVKALKDEQGEEVKQKDFCTSQLNQNSKDAAAKDDKKQDLERNIANLETLISELSESVASLKDQVAQTKTEMLRASQNREKENHEFQVVVADQRTAQEILTRALKRLKAFYDAKAAALLQAPGQASSDMPAQATYKKSGGASGAMSMIESIIQESADLEKESMAAESEAQADYEAFTKDSTASNEAAQRDIADKTKNLAQADGDKAEAEGDLRHTIQELLSLGETNQALHGQCDFLLQNFDLRQGKRTSEMEALNQAKAIFSGAGR